MVVDIACAVGRIAALSLKTMLEHSVDLESAIVESWRPVLCLRPAAMSNR